MDYYIVEVNETHVGIGYGTRARARKQAIAEFGRSNVTSVTTRAVSKEDLQHIRNMGGYVPLSLCERFGIEHD